MDDISKLIYNRRNSTLASREEIHKLIRDSYNAGESYTKNGHLHKMSLENSDSFKKRLSRSVYISHAKSLIDTLVGFIFEKKIKRSVAPELEYYINNINQTQSLDSFINSTAIHASLFTCALLVDAPTFDPEEVQSVADRERLKLFPYVKKYLPFQVRDYSYDKDGKLQWIIFDDTYVDASNPFIDSRDVIVRTLWTNNEVRKYYYTKDIDSNGKEDIKLDRIETIENRIGEIPVVFVSFRDIDNELYENSFAENICQLDKQIYNYFSLLELLLARNAIKPLAYPCKTGDDIPESLREAGKMDELTVIPFTAEFTNKPFFIEATNTEITSYITTINLLLEEIKNLIGLNKDQNLSGVSGKAKDRELQKIKVLLKQGSKNLEKCENEIFRLINKWEGANYQYQIEYNHDYNDEDIDSLIQNLLDLMAMIDSKTFKAMAVKDVVKKALPYASEEELNQISKEYTDSPTLLINNTKDQQSKDIIPDAGIKTSINQAGEP